MNRTDYLLRELRYRLSGIDWSALFTATLTAAALLVGIRAFCHLVAFLSVVMGLE